MSQPIVPGPMVRAQGRGCLGAAGLLVLGLAVVVACFSAAAIGASLAPVEWRLPVVMAGLVGSTLAFAVSALGFARARAARWDDAFAPSGLVGEPFLLTRRRWRGTFAGRSVEATLTKGPLLEVFVSAATATKAAIGARSGAGTAIGRMLGFTELPLADPAFAAFMASADDPAWGQAFFARARDGLLRLMTDPRGRELRSVMVEPGRLRYRRHFLDPEALTADDVRGMLGDLARVAAAADGAPAPAQTMTPGDATARNAAGVAKVGLFVVGLLLIVSACAISPIVILVLAAEGSRSALPDASPAVEPADEGTEPAGPRRRRLRRRR